MGRVIAAKDLQPGERIWVGNDAHRVVAVAADGDVVRLTIQLPHLGDVVATFSRDREVELADRMCPEDEKGGQQR